MTDIADPQAAPEANSAASAKNPAAALAARVAAFRREQVAVDYANRGLSTAEIAARLGIPEADARKKLRTALVRALPETPEDFAALQISRLNEVLLVAFSAMETMGLKAVDRVLRILRALDRQHAAARPLVALTAADIGAAEPAQRPPAPAPEPPAAARGRNPIAPQAAEKAQNRSQTPTPSLPPERPAAPPPPFLPRAAQRNGGGGPSAGRWRGQARRAQRRDEIRHSRAQTPGILRFVTDFAAPPRRPVERPPGWPVALEAPIGARLLAALGLDGASACALAGP